MPAATGTRSAPAIATWPSVTPTRPAPGSGPPPGSRAACRRPATIPTWSRPRWTSSLVDASCGGAKSENLTAPQLIGGNAVPAQIEAVTEDTDLVTVSIGANDGAVYGTLVTTCAALGAADPTGAPCSDRARKDPDLLPEIFQGVTATLVEAVAAILERAPDARVVIIGYPQIIPAEGRCAALPLAEGDYAFGRGVIQEFVESQKEAARQAKAEYVDVWAATDGHDICGEEPWIAGATTNGEGAAYHPYAAEQQAVADLVEALVSES